MRPCTRHSPARMPTWNERGVISSHNFPRKPQGVRSKCGYDSTITRTNTSFLPVELLGEKSIRVWSGNAHDSANGTIYVVPTSRWCVLSRESWKLYWETFLIRSATDSPGRGRNDA